MRIHVFIAAAAVIGLGGWGAAQAAESSGFLGQWRGLERLGIARSTLVLDVRFGCKLVHGKLVCGKDVNDGEGGKHGDDKPKTEKKSGNICEGGGSCPPGYVVLDKPNKYGACCEPKEGFPDKTSPTPAPVEQKCKYGMFGTWPNDCHCPSGTEFYGYQGCLQTCCGLLSAEDPKIKEHYHCNGDPIAARNLAFQDAATHKLDINKIFCERLKKPY